MLVREYRGAIGGALAGASALALITPLGLLAANQTHVTNPVVLGLFALAGALLVGAIVVFRLRPPPEPAPVGKSGYSETEIQAMETSRRELQLRSRQRKILDDQLWLAKQQIRDQSWPLGQSNNMELARVVREWIELTEKVLKDTVGEHEAVFFALDVGAPGPIVGRPGEGEIDLMSAIRQRSLDRLDRHIVRLQTIRDRL